jgi:hypothetical protein
MSDETVFRFNSNESVLFNNVLNEVINGFRVPEFERTIGMEKTSAKQLLEHIYTLRESDELDLGIRETRAVRNALCESLRNIPPREFQTRTGYYLERAKAILTKLDSLLASISSESPRGA